ncbi:hypothetical protein [Anaerorhabdus sp.]|uniref:hypothetical protein n=1 Tax=Anaerorhabdus sp. TaxID=1872524 RepID=UPI002FC760F8
MTLFNLINELFNDKNSWCYYAMVSENPIKNPSEEKSLNFMRQYFEAGSKFGLVIGDECYSNDDFDKHLFHTIIVFFLGILFYKRIYLKSKKFNCEDPLSITEGEIIFGRILFHYFKCSCRIVSSILRNIGKTIACI